MWCLLPQKCQLLDSFGINRSVRNAVCEATRVFGGRLMRPAAAPMPDRHSQKRKEALAVFIHTGD